MAKKREKLEARAAELGLTFVPETSDEDLQELINDFEDDGNPPQDEFEDTFSDDFKFYKSQISGLSVRIMETEDRSDTNEEKVRFVPYRYWDEARGDHYQLGLLATDEPEAIEILEDDHNVVEIDEQTYKKLVEEGTQVPY